MTSFAIQVLTSAENSHKVHVIFHQPRKLSSRLPGALKQAQEGAWRGWKGGEFKLSFLLPLFLLVSMKQQLANCQEARMFWDLDSQLYFLGNVILC